MFFSCIVCKCVCVWHCLRIRTKWQTEPQQSNSHSKRSMKHNKVINYVLRIDMVSGCWWQKKTQVKDHAKPPGLRIQEKKKKRRMPKGIQYMYILCSQWSCIESVLLSFLFFFFWYKVHNDFVHFRTIKQYIHVVNDAQGTFKSKVFTNLCGILRWKKNIHIVECLNSRNDYTSHFTVAGNSLEILKINPFWPIGPRTHAHIMIIVKFCDKRIV